MNGLRSQGENPANPNELQTKLARSEKQQRILIGLLIGLGLAAVILECSSYQAEKDVRAALLRQLSIPDRSR